MVTIGGAAPGVGESTFNLEPGERLRVRELLKAALVQSANDAAYALANYVGHGNVTRFVRLMNKRAAELGLDDTHYVRPDGLDTKGHYRRRVTRSRSREAMESRLFREIVRTKSGVVAGRQLYVWNDLLRLYPGTIGIKTGHTDRAGWSEIAAARRQGVTLYAVLLGGPTRGRRNADLSRLLDWGFDHYGSVRVITRSRAYATTKIPFSDESIELLSETSARATVFLGHPLVERVVAPARSSRPSGSATRSGRSASTTETSSSPSGPSLRARPSPSPGSPGGSAGTLDGPLTRQATCSQASRPSDDRHRHAERRSRSDAARPELPDRPAPSGQRRVPERGRQGDQHRARAQAPRRPVVCTGLAGGRNGTLLVEELTQEGDPQRLRPDPRRVAHVDAVLDPTSNAYTEINESGPEIADDELETLREKLAYLTQGADFVVFAGSLPRGVDDLLLRRRDPRRRPPPPARGHRRRRRAFRRASERSRTLSRPTFARPRSSSATSSWTRRISAPRSTRSPSSARATSSSRWRPGATPCCARTTTRCGCGRALPRSSRSRRSGGGHAACRIPRRPRRGPLVRGRGANRGRDRRRLRPRAGPGALRRAGGQPPHAARDRRPPRARGLVGTARRNIMCRRRRADSPPVSSRRSPPYLDPIRGRPASAPSERPASPGDERNPAKPS